MINTGLVFTVLCSLVLPITLTVYICLRKQGYWRALLAGALCFTFFQMVTRIPLIQYVLPKMEWYVTLAMSNPLLNILFLAVTASLFEEIGRYIVMRLFLKKHQSINDALSFGIGHGGIEAVLLVGVTFTLALFTQSPAMISQLTGATAFAAGVERLFTMAVHVGLSVMVMKSVREHKISFLLLALLIHTLIDFVPIYAMHIMGANLWIVEGMIGIAGIGLGWYSIYEFKRAKYSENSECPPQTEDE